MKAEAMMLPLDKLVSKNYREEGDVAELQASIATRGIKTPLLVIRRQDGLFDIHAGNRRKLAAHNLGIKEVPVFIIDPKKNDDDNLLDQLVENNLRKNDGVVLALKLKQLRDNGVKNKTIAEAMGKTEAWISTLVGLVITESPVYMAFITGKDLWYQTNGNKYKFFLTADDIKTAGENEADYGLLEGIGSEIPSISNCADLVKIYKTVINPSIPEQLYTFHKYIAALIAAKRNTAADINLVCGKIIKKLNESKPGPEEVPQLPPLDVDKVTESLVRIFSRGKLVSPKELQKACRNRFKKEGIPCRIYFEEWDHSKPDKEVEGA